MSDDTTSPKPDGHAGDCTIYASGCNNNPTDGICTCGYGLRMVRKCDYSHVYAITHYASETDARLIAADPEMLEVLKEVALPPYPDSDLESLLKTLQGRAKSIINKVDR